MTKPDPPEPTCRSCNTPWVNHLGHEGTCKRLRELMNATKRLLHTDSYEQMVFAKEALWAILDRIDAEDAEARNVPIPE